MDPILNTHREDAIQSHERVKDCSKENGQLQRERVYCLLLTVHSVHKFAGGVRENPDSINLWEEDTRFVLGMSGRRTKDKDQRSKNGVIAARQ